MQQTEKIASKQKLVHRVQNIRSHAKMSKARNNLEETHENQNTQSNFKFLIKNFSSNPRNDFSTIVFRAFSYSNYKRTNK